DDGSTSYQAFIATRRGGPSSVSNLLNKNIIALSQDSIAGYAFPLFELAKSGTNLSNGTTTFDFGTKYNSATQKFASAQGDAIIGWSSFIGDADTGYSRGTLKDLVNRYGFAMDNLQVIWKSSNIAHNVHSIRKNVPGEAKAMLRDILQSLEKNDPVAYDSIEPVYGGGFVIARQQNFFPMINFAKEPLAGIAK
ncbi:MAG: PhnD/SsuA/transferrin family substrate-binding protein, partial [Nitratireductor sp.]